MTLDSNCFKRLERIQELTPTSSMRQFVAQELGDINRIHVLSARKVCKRLTSDIVVLLEQSRYSASAERVLVFINSV